MVLSTCSDDDVLFTVGDSEEAVVVEAPDVARVHPIACEGLRGLLGQAVVHELQPEALGSQDVAILADDAAGLLEVAQKGVYQLHCGFGESSYSVVELDGKPVKDAVDNDWYVNDFIPTVQQRGAAIIKARDANV